MKISIVNESKQNLGGGFSFINNLVKGLQSTDHELTNWQEADVVLIPSSTMISKELFRTIQGANKKIVLRCDNMPKNSNNRNCGSSRIQMMADGADKIVYQSEWATEYLVKFLKKDGIVIHNSVDETIFKVDGEVREFDGDPVYLFSRYNRDETKHWHVAWYEYQKIQCNNPSAKLIIVGKFSDNIRSYNFDFYNNENIEYIGIIDSKEEMAKVYRGVDVFMMTYYNDACSNTFIESLMCGCEATCISMTGGTPEIMKKWKENGREYFSLKRMTEVYISLFESL